MPAKICVICNEDCSTKPRIKNQAGQYACQACVEAKKAAKAQAPEPELEPEEPIGLADELGMAGLLDDLPDIEAATGPSEIPAGSSGCPSCGFMMPPGAVICTNCGYNASSGKAARTSVRQNAPGEGGAAAAKKAGMVLALPVLWTIGGLVGGGLGAVAWALLRGYANLEIGYLAVGVGLATGFGVVVAGQGRTGFIAGLWAAAMSVVCLFGGKVGGAAIAYNQYLSSDEAEVFEISDEEAALSWVADDVVTEWETDEGRDLDWPPGMDALTAGSSYEYWPTGYPPEVVEEARSRWEDFTPESQQEYLNYAAEDQELSHAVTSMSAVMFDFSMFDVLWFGIAVVAAFGVGKSGGDD